MGALSRFEPNHPARGGMNVLAVDASFALTCLSGKAQYPPQTTTTDGPEPNHRPGLIAFERIPEWP
jgi:hypothetical protein